MSSLPQEAQFSTDDVIYRVGGLGQRKTGALGDVLLLIIPEILTSLGR